MQEGKKKLVQLKPISKYELQDETTNEEIVEVKVEIENKFDEKDRVSNAIL